MRCAGTARAVPNQGARSSRKVTTGSPAVGLLAPGAAFGLSGTNAIAATAGVVVNNTAALSFDVDGAEQTVSSNTVSIILAERIDLAVAADVPTALAPGAGESAVGFRVANRGNGAEVFTLVAGARGGTTSVLRIAAGADDNGVYDPNIGRELTSLQLLLDAGADLGLFVIVGGIQAPTASADTGTGTGTPGTLFGSKGQGGAQLIGDLVLSKPARVAMTAISSASPPMAAAIKRGGASSTTLP